MKSKKNWLIPVILTVAAGVAVAKSAIAPASPTILPETTAVASEVVTSVPAQGKCAYTSAYHDAPELTAKVSKIVRDLNPKSKAVVTLYGEDCVYADGHADFSAMETDFYVKLPVEDQQDQEALGNWMAQVMEAIIKIPRAEISGNDGFVEFWFEGGGAERTIIRIPIQTYKEKGQGKSGKELFMMFSIFPL